MDTIIYSAIGMIIIVSAALSITFFEELKHGWKHAVTKVRDRAVMLGRNARDHHEAV